MSDSTLSDLEMTRLCAEAMGIKTEVSPIRGTVLRHWFMDENVQRIYDPLHDDEKIMALVKMFRINLSVDPDLGLWRAERPNIYQNRKFGVAEHADLNRAVMMCAALAQLAKTKP